MSGFQLQRLGQTIKPATGTAWLALTYQISYRLEQRCNAPDLQNS